MGSGARGGRCLPGRPRLARDQGADVEFPARPGAPPAAPRPAKHSRFRPLSLQPHPRPPRASPAPHGGRRAPGGRAGGAPRSRGPGAAVPATAAAAALAAGRPHGAPGAEPARPQRVPRARVGSRPSWERGTWGAPAWWGRGVRDPGQVGLPIPEVRCVGPRPLVCALGGAVRPRTHDGTVGTVGTGHPRIPCDRSQWGADRIIQGVTPAPRDRVLGKEDPTVGEGPTVGQASRVARSKAPCMNVAHAGRVQGRRRGAPQKVEAALAWEEDPISIFEGGWGWCAPAHLGPSEVLADSAIGRMRRSGGGGSPWVCQAAMVGRGGTVGDGEPLDQCKKVGGLRTLRQARRGDTGRGL